MERLKWKTIIRSKPFSFDFINRATDGQITWVFLNQLVDYDEKTAFVHAHCMHKWEADYCPVCNEVIGTPTVARSSDIILPPGVEVYKPGEEIETPLRTLMRESEEHKLQRDQIEALLNDE